jgi:hypothetical protein
MLGFGHGDTFIMKNEQDCRAEKTFDIESSMRHREQCHGFRDGDADGVSESVRTATAVIPVIVDSDVLGQVHLFRGPV